MTIFAAVLAATLASAAPKGFDPEANMTVNDSGLHSVRDTMNRAAGLVSRGGPEDLTLAGKMIDAVIQCQEQRLGHAHYGNFLWYKENGAVEDLNGVSFTLATMIPMMIRHGNRLPDALRMQIFASIRRGLAATKRLDVSPGYTNIALFDIENTCLGGELLADEEILARGRQKLILWMSLTDQYGIPFEYNSPTYTGVAIGSLSSLATHSKDREIQVRARTALARIGLSVALHVHPSTGRWAGPHSRAYSGDLSSSLDNRVAGWANNGTFPIWAIDAMTHRPARMQVTETAHSGFNMGITTFHSPSFALGVSTTEGLGGQGNSLICQFRRKAGTEPGVLYSRYLINDKWMGTFFHPTDRRVTNDLMQEGRFYGVQQGPRAIALYTPAALQYTTSAKATLICRDREAVDKILVNGQRIDKLPAPLSPHDTVVICSGDVMIGVRALTCTDLGYQSPIRLVQLGNDLVLEMHNYKGPKKVFWELQWPGGFFKGVPQSGFFIEMAERSDYESAAQFGRVVAGGKLTDVTEVPFTYAGEGERLWTVEYSRDDRTLGIEVDLIEWDLRRRWNEKGPMGWPMLESPVARETRTGQVTVGDATLQFGKEAGWLFGSPQSKRWAAGTHGSMSAPLTLTVPDGRVEIEGITVGTVFWDNGKVTVDAIGLQGKPRVTGGHLSE